MNMADFRSMDSMVQLEFARALSIVVAVKSIVIEMTSGACRIFSGYNLLPLQSA